MTNAFTTSGVFGGLLSDRAIAEEFGETAFVDRILAFETAWTRALAQIGYVSAQDADTALAAIKGFSSPSLGAASDRDGLPVPALVASLRQGLSDKAALAVHTGATSQDAMDTAMVLTCLAVIDQLSDRLARVIVALDRLLDRFGALPLIARTRMQKALPATVSLRVDAWRRPLVDHHAMVAQLRAQMAVVQIGGPIGARETPYPHVQDCAGQVAQALGLSLCPVWHVDRSRSVALGHWLTLVAGTLGKIGQDITLMAQQGVDELELSGGGGSSAMAHKKNPIAAEMMVALARFVAGQNGSLGQVLIHEQERSGAAWALEWLTLPAMAEATGTALRHAEDVLGSIERIGTLE